jgi:hypothetical protein
MKQILYIIGFVVIVVAASYIAYTRSKADVESVKGAATLARLPTDTPIS